MAAPNLNAILSALLTQVQKAESALTTTIVSRFLGHAQGVQLDAYGRLVGEARLGRSDDDFRKGIRLRIFVNGSNGRPEDLIYITRQLTGFQTINYYDIPTPTGNGGNCRIVIPGWPGDDGSVLAFLQSVCPAGVRLLGVTASPTGTYFRMKHRMKERLFTL
jgi:hypothetical protein